MKIFRNIYAVVIVLLVSTTAFATSQDGADNSQDMPMMNQDGGMMMSPEMMGQMMASAKMNSEMMEQMMASGKMNSEMMEQMMASGKMNPEMMQMRMQHMVKMEQHLGNIESLLAKILEAQKSE